MAVLVALQLAACGGAIVDGTAGEGRAVRSAPAAPPTTPAATPVVSPLLDDEGHMNLPNIYAMPSDPAARTASGHYATASQAHDLQMAMGQQVIALTVVPGADAVAVVEATVQAALKHQIEHTLKADAPVLVSGPDARVVAAAAQGLEAAGYTRVFAVRS